jgi:hypothetical protein
VRRFSRVLFWLSPLGAKRQIYRSLQKRIAAAEIDDFGEIRRCRIKRTFGYQGKRSFVAIGLAGDRFVRIGHQPAESLGNDFDKVRSVFEKNFDPRHRRDIRVKSSRRYAVDRTDQIGGRRRRVERSYSASAGVKTRIRAAAQQQRTENKQKNHPSWHVSSLAEVMLCNPFSPKCKIYAEWRRLSIGAGRVFCDIILSD